MGVPYSAKQLNRAYSAYTPSTVHVTNTEMAYFYRRYLFQKAIAQVKVTVPRTWERAKNWLMYLLFGTGYVGVFNTGEYGTMFDRVGLGGLNVFYQPSYFIVANPLITPSRQVQIGTEGELLMLQPTYSGIADLCIYYGDLLALAAETAAVNLQNSKISTIFAADNKSAAESFKKLYDCISAGEPATTVDKSLFKVDERGQLVPGWLMFSQNVKNTYVVSDILSDMRKIEAMFDTEVGIPNANTDKKERLVTNEVDANNVSTYSLLSMWLESLQESCERVHRMFGLTKSDLWFDWRFPPDMMGGDDDASDRIDASAAGVRPDLA